MKDKLIWMALAINLICPFRALSQDRPRAVELGIGGSAINHTRTMVSDFHVTKGGDYVFTLEEKLLYGGVDLYSALELNPWLYIDLQGTLGLAKYCDSGVMKQGYSILAGPGIQFRPFISSEWVQPYLRLGMNYYHKDFPTTYFGQFEGDITKEALWKAEDAWNKGNTFDADSFFPLSAGIGITGWVSNRVGVRIEGDYLRSLGSRGANFALGSVGVVFRIGGKDKRQSLRGPERIVERVVEKEIVKEVPVEKVREVIKEIPCERILDNLMDNVTFDFDKSDLTPESEAVLDEVARIIGLFPEDRFIVSGYTDARGGRSYNERLSHDRARAVYEALTARGVPESRLCYRGFGESVAIVPENADDETRRGDRKVVIERVTWDPLWEYLKNNNQ